MLSRDIDDQTEPQNLTSTAKAPPNQGQDFQNVVKDQTSKPDLHLSISAQSS
jgi:hypothetical protein